MAPGLSDIDWAAPWHDPWRAVGTAVTAAAVAGGLVCDALNACGQASVRFVPQQALPEGMAYEAFIFERGCVPTRDNLHDFFNGLCWLRFPQAKRRLNQLQAAEIAAVGVGSVRGPVRDGITVFDENAALLQAPDALWNALVDRRWGELFGSLRPLWHQARLVLFGHALLEKLVVPYKSITAHVWRVADEVDASDVQALDHWLAQDLTPVKLAAKPFAPLPVLGVPGWWAANAEPDFYRDEHVFRPVAHRRRA